MIETAVIVLLLTATFLAGEYVHPFKQLVHDNRSLVSFGSGMAVAYVFMQIMPELQTVRSLFVASAPVPLWFEGKVIYLLALLGFLLFYGLNNLSHSVSETGYSKQERWKLQLHIGSLAAYVWLIGYMLVQRLDPEDSLVLYAMATIFHFLAISHELPEKYGVLYGLRERFILAGMCMLGWAAGQLFALPHMVLALMVAFISGGIIINSIIMELPKEKDGRFLPFVAGGVCYALILLPLG
ncbi:hypothetical protein HNR75_000999 [Tolumonas osonensis]|uniref:ZIP Zinc transporter n=1 Tax=Tolumonas osonensis TaxID=675874 RepID=A0A841GBY6_9GAMM|nr:hypothetical protein [Tolumonas osonensis]